MELKASTAKIITGTILLTGVVLRFYFQFIDWSFNGDEVHLGLEIINQDLQGLLGPFQSRQSAPPLFLFIQKILSHIAKPFISLKILTFLTSCTSIFLFNIILRRTFPQTVYWILLALFCVNPFIISNSLTLKQYSVDLMMGLMAVSFFIRNKNGFISFLFFAIFCLVSNVGLFFSASFLILNLLEFSGKKNRRGILNFKTIKKIFPYLLAPIPYLLYFVWFLQQSGAEEMKVYMVNYWSGAFMPLDFSIFRWLAIQAKVFMIFFFSTYWLVGLPLLILFFWGAIVLIYRRKELVKKTHFKVILVYTLTTFIHLLLSAMHLYPFSDRLFLYLAPGIYLILGVGVCQLNVYSIASVNFRIIKSIALGIIVFATVLYMTYQPERTNNVHGLLNFINSRDDTVVLTPKAKQLTHEWLKFTGYDEQNPEKLINSTVYRSDNLNSENYLIGVQNKKFGHRPRLTSPEPIIIKLEQRGEIVLYKRINGYSIYVFN